MCEERVGNVCLHVLMDKVEQRMESAVGVPQRELGEICKALFLLYVLVETSELAVSVVVDERTKRCVVGRGVECAHLLCGALYRVA